MTSAPARLVDGASDGVPGPGRPVEAPRRREGHRRRAATRRRRRTVLRGLLAVGIVLLLLGGWLVWRGLQVARAAESVVPAVRAAQEALLAGDVATARARADEVREGADQAVAATSDPVWRAATHLPWAGRQLSAVTDVVGALDLVATGVVTPLTEVGDAIGPEALRLVDGGLDLAALRTAAPVLEEAAVSARAAHARVAAVRTDGLIPPLADQVAEAETLLGDATATLESASTAARLLPPVLGGDGTRRYLLLALNPAELRSGGGLVGAIAVLTADDGAVRLEEHLTAADFPRYTDPVVPLAAGEETVHTSLLAERVQNTTMTPDFPRTAEVLLRMWQDVRGTSVDGVVALDPVALAGLLEVTGPVTVRDQSLDAGNAPTLLLSQAYADFPDPVDTDLFFAEAAAAVFEAVVGGAGDLRALAPALAEAGDAGRLLVWSAHDEEQAQLRRGALSGDFLSGDHTRAVGIFLDDATGSKLGYHLASTVQVQHVCGSDAATVVLELASGVPADPTTLPAYVLGPEVAGLDRGTARTNVTVYAPVGGAVTAIRRDGATVGGRTATDAGRDVVVVTSELAPGATERYEVDVRLGQGTRDVPVWTTPGVEGSGRVVAACT